MGECCFRWFSHLRRVTFGPSSSLERIGVSCFEWSGIEEVFISNSVRELCDRCFERCSRLRRVTFGPSSSVERVGGLCFCGCSLVEFKMPASVRAIGGGAFSECASTGGIVCRDGCCFRAIDGLVLSDDCTRCFCSYGILSSVCIPDYVRELCDGCFAGCSLCRVTFGRSSSLERIGFHALGALGGRKPWSRVKSGTGKKARDICAIRVLSGSGVSVYQVSDGFIWPRLAIQGSPPLKCLKQTF